MKLKNWNCKFLGKNVIPSLFNPIVFDAMQDKAICRDRKVWSEPEKVVSAVPSDLFPSFHLEVDNVFRR